MKMSEAVKPISYFKAHASEVVREVMETQRPVVITLNGEAKAIVQDLREYEKMEDSLALLKILAMGQKDVEARNTKPSRTAFADIRTMIKKERL